MSSRRSLALLLGLIGKLGDQVFEVFNAGFFDDRPGGTLLLRVNGCDEGLYDNGGTLSIAFAPGEAH